MTRGRGVMTFAAILSFCVALTHLVIIAIGAPAYAFFTAPAVFVEIARQGSPVPAIVTLVLAAFFVAFGLYAWSAAGHAPRLPQRRILLIGISGVYTLRGLIVVPELLVFLNTTDVPLRALWFSLISLFIGIVYITGTALRWPAIDH